MRFGPRYLHVTGGLDCNFYDHIPNLPAVLQKLPLIYINILIYGSYYVKPLSHGQENANGLPVRVTVPEHEPETKTVNMVHSHISYLISHTSCLIPHASYLILIPHTSCLMPHTSCLMPPYALITFIVIMCTDNTKSMRYIKYQTRDQKRPCSRQPSNHSISHSACNERHWKHQACHRYFQRLGSFQQHYGQHDIDHYDN